MTRSCIHRRLRAPSMLTRTCCFKVIIKAGQFVGLNMLAVTCVTSLRVTKREELANK